MAGRGDEEAGGAARAEAWLMRMHDLLKTAAEEAVRRLTPLPADADDAAVDRRARLIVNAARAVKATADLAARPAPRAARPEDDMTEKDIDDIDPGDLARVRAELESRLDHVARIVEQKRLAGWAGSGATGGGPSAPAPAALAPDPAPG